MNSCLTARGCGPIAAWNSVQSWELPSRWKIGGDSLPPVVRRALEAGPDAMLAGCEPLPYSRDERSASRLRLADCDVVLKKYREHKPRHRLRQLLRRSRAEKVYRVTQLLVERGVATPRPIAYVNSMWGPFSGPDSYYLYEYLPGETIEQLSYRGELEPGLRQSLLDQGVKLYRALSRLGLVLPDPRARNFVVDRHERLWAIDLDQLVRPLGKRSMKRWMWHSFRWFMAELHWPFDRRDHLSLVFDEVPHLMGFEGFSDRRNAPAKRYQWPSRATA